ncbi:MAG: P-II family nitrogen regulator [Elusimicrobiota bacterium]|jgi:nitrogen regulatory protein P-II 1|nr:P-II family nitrogen regulator [Elusimicrobiota bacterium]
MKRLEIFIRPDKLEILQTILNNQSVSGMTVATVMGYGRQKEELEDKQSKGIKLKGLKIAGMNLIPKVQVITVVDDAAVNEILNNIHEKISMNKVGDGKVFVTNVEEAMRVRTGERGEKAL